MSKEKETKQKFKSLLEWLEEIKFNAPADIQCQVMNMLEAWLSTDYANNPSHRNAYYHNSKLLTQGMTIINSFTQDDFNSLQDLMQ